MLKDLLNPMQLRIFMESLDDVGYESVLLTYHYNQEDYFIKSAACFFKGQKTKYMIAMRPYAIAPAYFSMMINGYNQIKNNKLIINIVSGTKDEDQAIFGEVTSSVDRKKLAGDFISQLRQINKVLPPIYFSGGSPEAISNTIEHGDGIIYLLQDHLTTPERFDEIKGVKMLRVHLIIKDTYEEAEKVFNDLDHVRQKANCIYGTKETVLKEIEKLKGFELMVSSTKGDNSNEYINDIVRECVTL